MIKNKYFDGLDVIRGSAIIMVLWWHLVVCITPEANLPLFIRKILDYSGITWSGVDLFFVLSGFLITNILLNAKVRHDGIFFFINFFVRRFFRIFPAYLLLLLLFISFKYLNIHTLVNNSDLSHPIFSYFLFIQNFYMSEFGFGPYFLGATWSLAIEEQFYLFLPIFVYFFSNRQLAIFFIFGILLAPIFRFFYLNTVLGSFVLLPSRMDSLFVGGAIALFYFNNYFNFSINTIMRTMIISFVLLIPTFVYFKWKLNLQIGSPLIHSLLSYIYGIVILYVVSQNFSLQNRYLKYMFNFFAKLSYPIYLFHEVILSLFHQFIFHLKPENKDLNSMVITIVSLIITILVSYVVHKLVEKPIIQFSKKFA